MFRALSFITMRQQQRESAQAPPLGFTGGNKLIDNDLCDIGEVAVLCLPDDQRFRISRGITVFKGKHCLF